MSFMTRHLMAENTTKKCFHIKNVLSKHPVTPHCQNYKVEDADVSVWCFRWCAMLKRFLCTFFRSLDVFDLLYIRNVHM